MSYAIDVSHHQDPAALPWDLYRGKVDAVIVRAAYGTTLDRQSHAHVEKAREIGANVGLYLFFRQALPIGDHLAALRVVADTCHIIEGNVVPALDIEDDPKTAGGQVGPSWSNKAEDLVGKVVEEWGDCLVYITQRDWGRLGKPEWVLHRPLWCAHYTAAAKPATPVGIQCVAWQHRVGPFDPGGPGGVFSSVPGNVEIDQSRILSPLPLVGSRITDEDRERVRQLVAVSLADDARSIDQDADTEPPGAA